MTPDLSPRRQRAQDIEEFLLAVTSGRPLAVEDLLDGINLMREDAAAVDPVVRGRLPRPRRLQCSLSAVVLEAIKQAA